MDVNPNFQAKNEDVDSPSQQPATFEPIPYLSYLTEEPEDEEDEPVPKAHTIPVYTFTSGSVWKSRGKETRQQ